MLRVSAPGSTMVAGEHAVVYGHSAIVCAIDQRATLELTPLSRPVLEIASTIAPPLSVSMDELPLEGPYRFLLRAVAPHRERLTGLRIDVSSAIDPTMGLGSSAAITAAAVAGLDCLTQAGGDLHAQALAIVRAVQGRGSGADLAASLTGGMLAYRVDGAKATITSLPSPPPLALGYAGYKTPTAEVLARIAEAMVGREAHYADLYARIGAATERAIIAARSRDWSAFGEALGDNRQLMKALGVSDSVLDRLIATASETPDVLAAKISGSGLGDCVLAIGSCPPGFSPAPVAERGVIFDDESFSKKNDWPMKSDLR